MSRRRDERRDAREQLNRLEDPVRRIPTRVLDAICDAAVGEQREPVEREGRACAITHQTLARGVIVGADRHGGVEVEAVERDGIASEARGLVVIALVAPERGLALELVEQSRLECDVRAGVEHVGLCGGLEVAIGIEVPAGEPARYSVSHAGEHGHELGAGR